VLVLKPPLAAPTDPIVDTERSDRSLWVVDVVHALEGRLKQLSRYLLHSHSTFSQPESEIGDQTDLHLPRLPGVTFSTHLRSVSIDIRSQGTFLFAQTMCLENLLH